MCQDCGCDTANASFFESNPNPETIHLSESILKRNDDIAHHNWHWFDDNKILAMNIMSSPGSGKTSLLEYTLPLMNKEYECVALIGDQQTENDAQRIKATGCRAYQISTHSSCHLDASMVEKTLKDSINGSEDFLFIENVGNLVCPSAFDLGERLRIALISVTEGEDKPEKYPVLFHKADLVVITKTDLMPYLDWDKEKFLNSLRKVNPKVKTIFLSTKTEEGTQEWLDWLNKKHKEVVPCV